MNIPMLEGMACQALISGMLAHCGLITLSPGQQYTVAALTYVVLIIARRCK